MPEVRITAVAAQDLERLPLVIQSRMQHVFERLQLWPRVSGARPLRGTLAGRYRIRSGDYRVQFCVRGTQIREGGTSRGLL